MTKQTIDTDRIVASATALRTANSNIGSAFQTLQNSAKRLEDNWKGAAGTTAQTTVQQIFKISEERSKVLQNYVNFLEQQVNPGYIDTETVNTTLADKFK